MDPIAERLELPDGYGRDAQAYEGALGLYPRRVLAWSAFPRDATRFRFV